jgi:hypothetical protein
MEEALRFRKSRLLVLASLVGLAWLTSCGGGGSTSTGPTISAWLDGSPLESFNLLLEQTQKFTIEVGGSPAPTVTCTMNPNEGSCSVTGTSVSYTAPVVAPSGDAWSPTLVLTATNTVDSATAKVTVELGQITGVTVTGPSAAAMNMKPVYTAVVSGNGTFPSTVTWGLTPKGRGSIVANSSSGNEDTATYTPPQQASQIQGFPSVTITATAADGTVGNATVNLGVASISYFTPTGQQNDSTTGAGAVSVTSTATMAIVADQRVISGSSQTAAGLVLCDLKAGGCADAWSNRDSKNNLLPSQINDIAAFTDGVTFYGTGKDGLPPTQATLLKSVLTGNALRVTKFVPDFQVATGTRAQGQLVQLDQSGNIYTAVNGDCPPTSSPADCVDVGGWVYEFSPAGVGESDFPIASPYPMVVTGVDVEVQYTLVQTNVLSATTGDITNPDLGFYLNNGQLVNYTSGGFEVYNARVVVNGDGTRALVGGQYDVSATDREFGLYSPSIQDDSLTLPQFFVSWNGGVSGASVCVAQNAVANPWGGIDVLGSCSSVGSTDLTNGPTDGALASWFGNPASGSTTPSLICALRLDSSHVPGGGTISVIMGGRYWKDADGLWHLTIWGVGSDGTTCGGAICTKVVIVDVIPKQQTQSQ